MSLLLQIIIIFSALAFLYYGITCLTSPIMKKEFHRFGLSDQKRILTGILQITGAVGLILGFLITQLGAVAALGLSILMLLGFRVRVKIRDPLTDTLPSFVFMILNGWIFIELWFRS
jgi:uncharacterized membrane protein YphA (DoxX/SURF4 family)